MCVWTLLRLSFLQADTVSLKIVVYRSTRNVQFFTYFNITRLCQLEETALPLYGYYGSSTDGGIRTHTVEILNFLSPTVGLHPQEGLNLC